VFSGFPKTENRKPKTNQLNNHLITPKKCFLFRYHFFNGTTDYPVIFVCCEESALFLFSSLAAFRRSAVFNIAAPVAPTCPASTHIFCPLLLFPDPLITRLIL
jgi:hypothetical protein